LCVTSLPQAYGNEPCQKLWFQVSYILVALEINKYGVEKCIYTVYTGNIYTVYTGNLYTTGPYDHQ